MELPRSIRFCLRKDEIQLLSKNFTSNEELNQRVQTLLNRKEKEINEEIDKLNQQHLLVLQKKVLTIQKKDDTIVKLNADISTLKKHLFEQKVAYETLIDQHTSLKFKETKFLKDLNESQEQYKEQRDAVDSLKKVNQSLESKMEELRDQVSATQREYAKVRDDFVTLSNRVDYMLNNREEILRKEYEATITILKLEKRDKISHYEAKVKQEKKKYAELQAKFQVTMDNYTTLKKKADHLKPEQRKIHTVDQQVGQHILLINLGIDTSDLIQPHPIQETDQELTYSLSSMIDSGAVKKEKVLAKIPGGMAINAESEALIENLSGVPLMKKNQFEGPSPEMKKSDLMERNGLLKSNKGSEREKRDQAELGRDLKSMFYMNLSRTEGMSQQEMSKQGKSKTNLQRPDTREIGTEVIAIVEDKQTQCPYACPTAEEELALIEAVKAVVQLGNKKVELKEKQCQQLISILGDMPSRQEDLVRISQVENEIKNLQVEVLNSQEKNLNTMVYIRGLESELQILRGILGCKVNGLRIKTDQSEVNRIGHLRRRFVPIDTDSSNNFAELGTAKTTEVPYAMQSHVPFTSHTSIVINRLNSTSHKFYFSSQGIISPEKQPLLPPDAIVKLNRMKAKRKIYPKHATADRFYSQGKIAHFQ